MINLIVLPENYKAFRDGYFICRKLGLRKISDGIK